ncbi:hypothetical protein QYE76_018564 [Lolium multiflorum]|uniref:Uncharacterized protein n=1 Tax=Lolium multiflorum TaxID=4521 RepID=A0AAD8QCH5_LOLMU|nr:hypothetical protein QYE76_018564 [Lolium multiflorum]
MAAPTSSNALTLHTSRATASIGDTIALQASQITEKSQSDESLGSLEKSKLTEVTSKMTEVTSGLGKDSQSIIDPRGLRRMNQQLARLKRCMRETDTAWFDVDKNITAVLESWKKLFEDLLWEHRELPNAHKSLQVAYQQSQGENDTLSSQHQAELQRQREETARLKEELIQLKLQHTTELKHVVDAGKSELDHARKELEELHAREIKEVQDQLQGELQAEKDLRDLEKKRNDALQEVQNTQAKIIADLENFPESQAQALEAVAKTWHGDPAFDADVWTIGDHLTALATRVSYMGKLGKHLPDAAIRTFANLWPGEKVPDCIEVIASRLMESGVRLTEWRRSAARSGADTALKRNARSGLTRSLTTLQSAKFIPAPPEVEDEESEDGESDSEGGHAGDSEEAVDEDIVIEDPLAKPAGATPQYSASKSQAPGGSMSGNPDAGLS